MSTDEMSPHPYFNPTNDPEWAEAAVEIPMSPELTKAVKAKVVQHQLHYHENSFSVSGVAEKWKYRNYVSTLGDKHDFNSLHRADLRNKLTGFYWLPDAQSDCRLKACHESIIAAICKKWWRCYSSAPPSIRLGYFFAEAIRILPDGPLTIPGIVASHLALCDREESHEISSGPSSSSSFTYPRYRMLPLFRAVIVILENRNKDVCPTWGNEALTLDDLLEGQNVMLVRTGDDAHLSTPITFESLISTNTSSLSDTGHDTVGSDSISVSLGTAIQFLVDLQYRERDALFKVRIQRNNEIANKRRESEEADTKSFLENMEWGDDIFYTMFQEPSSGSLPPDTLKFNLLDPPPSNTARAEREADEIMAKAADRGLENN
jgi:hypothetical protein